MNSRADVADQLIDMSGWYAELALLDWLLNSCLVPALGRGPATIADIAAWADYREERIAPVLDALVGLGFVDLSGEGYVMGSAVEKLVPGGSGYLGDAIAHHARYWRLWSELPALLIEGTQPTKWTLDYAVGVKSASHDLLLRSTATETTIAERSEILSFMLARESQTLVDIGGGPGTLAHQAVASKPVLHAEVWDTSASEGVWRATADSLPASIRRRVSFRACDLLEQATWTTARPDADLCIISHVLANYSLEVGTRLLTEVLQTFPNSKCFVITPWRPFGDARDPLSALLFDVLIQSATFRGAAHTNVQIERAITEAGGLVLDVREVSESGIWKFVRR